MRAALGWWVVIGWLTVGWSAEKSPTLNQIADGYRGIWYMNQPDDSPYKYKYSGGLGTYCAKHRPFAVYRPEVDRTFFCYGGADKKNVLLHMVSYYDHQTGLVPRPTTLLNKRTNDAHDNPVISVDQAGHVWIFSTAHGTSRPSFVHRSAKPYDIRSFERVPVRIETKGDPVPVTNFSYFQAWAMPGRGFVFFLTRYEKAGGRVAYFSSTDDGSLWTPWQKLASIDQGHYQISAVHGGKAGTAFNAHPRGKGLNWRTNLYYMETPDRGKSWRSVDGASLKLPLTGMKNPALVRDYRREGRLVYLKDIRYDENGHPLVLYITSNGYRAGPENDPRTWTLARWTGTSWVFSEITQSDNNYDMGSLFLDENALRLVGPTLTGPQPFNPGGEMAMWESRDAGATWGRLKTLTRGSEFNHTYARAPVNAHPDFYALWADGHGRQPSISRLYFCNRAGDVFQLPEHMTGEFENPLAVPLKK